MRKLIVLLLCVVFMNSCSWFGSKSSSNASSFDAEIETLDEDEDNVADIDSDDLDGDDLDGDELDGDDLDGDDKDDINNVADISEDELDSNELDSNELDSNELDSDELDSNELGSDELDSDKEDSSKDNANNVADISEDKLDAEDNLEDKTKKSVVTEPSNNEEEVANGKKEKSYSDGFVDTNEDSQAGTEEVSGNSSDTESARSTENTEDVYADSDSDSSSDSDADSDSSSFDTVATKTYISVKKIKSVPYTKNNILVNAVYIARQGDTLRSVSNKIYALYKKTQLLKINPHLRKYNEFPVGTKIYYNSPSRAEDSVNLLTYYEEQNLQPQVYTTVEGDNLRTLGKQLLGHSRSWQELWATNSALESKNSLPAGTSIHYWSKASFDASAQQAIAQKTEAATAAKQAAIQEQETARLAAIEQKKSKEEKLKTETSAAKNKATVTETSDASATTTESGLAEANTPPVNPNSLDRVEDNLNVTKKADITKANTASQAKDQAKDLVKVEGKEANQKGGKVKALEDKVVINAKPAAITTAALNSNFFDQALALLDDDIVLYSLMAFFLLIVIFLFMRKRKGRLEDEYNEENIEDLDENTNIFLGSSNKEVSSQNATQMGATQMDSTQMDATQMDATQMDSTQMGATQMDATQMDATMNATQMDATQMDAEDLELESNNESVLLSDEDDEKAAG